MNYTPIQNLQQGSTQPRFREAKVDEPQINLSWLDEAERLLSSDNPCKVATGVRLTRDCSEFLRCSSETQWATEIIPALRKRRAYSLIQEDPLSSGSVKKSRGYSGDATLIDLIYGHADATDLLKQASSRGRAIASFTTKGPAPRAVCNRLFAIACEMDMLAAQVGKSFSCLSIACGHFREAELSQAITLHNFSRCVAIDQDQLSIQHAAAAYGALGIDFRVSRVSSLVARKIPREDGFDFIYAAGLFDYLADDVATALVEAAFELLKPGGKLWVPNFVVGIPDRGFMECFMDWWLIYRSEAKLQALAASIDSALIASQRTFIEPEGNVAFLELQRVY